MDFRGIRRLDVVFASALMLVWCAGGLSIAGEIEPAGFVVSRDAGLEPIGRYSDRTVVAGIEVDRDEARLLSYTVKPRPFVRPVEMQTLRAYEEGHETQVEVVLSGPGGLRYTQRVDAGMICLSHGAADEPHVAGDTIVMHRDSFLVELPELPGFDTIEVAYHQVDRGEVRRKQLDSTTLDAARFAPAAGQIGYDSLLFARSVEASASAAPQAATVLWPENFADPDIYRVYGDPGQVNERINIVIVPDGYTYAQKSLMETHAASTVAHFRSKSPHQEHDPFINYILVYAYSVQSGTDQCDCATTVDTAMGTRFPLSTPTCGHNDNRCLSYGSGCDTNGTTNLVAAELRAPAQDETLVMVNTTRYGGCGGSRATYSAGNSSAFELAVHELGHSMGGLADEYFYNSNCGSFAGGINTSTNAVSGAWPEWIASLGAPKQGGQYYGTCIYRPENDCEMRNLNRPFCAVCKQRYSQFTYGHYRVNPTAPIRSITPPGNVVVPAPTQVDFSVETRLSAAPATSDIKWTLDGPGLGGPTVVASGTAAYSRIFAVPGQFTLTVEVAADTNLVKLTSGTNREQRSWIIDVTIDPPGEVSAPGAQVPLHFEDKVTAAWEDASSAGAETYNVYRGGIETLGSGSYGDCYRSELIVPETSINDDPDPTTGWYFIVAGENAAGEGPLGHDSLGGGRTSATPCN